MKFMFALLLSIYSYSLPSFAQDFSKTEIKAQKVSRNVYMLEGAGGNLGVITGDDGILMIDDQFAPLSDKISAALKKLSEKPLRFIINTHWHFDHTGGNENFGKAGAIIVAHDNVRKLLSKDQFVKVLEKKIPATKKEGLPVITFAESINFHLNGEEINVVHIHNAHTDNDSIIHFKKANVIHTGDIFVNGSYSFLDVQHGGSIDGVIAGTKAILQLTNSSTKIIPGHGPLGSVKDLKDYLSMFETARTNVAALITKGMKREEAINAHPLASYDAKWGKGFLTTDKFVGIVYDSLVKTTSKK